MVVAVAVLLVALYSAVVTFVAQPYLIPSEAMAPTLNAGDRVMVNKVNVPLRLAATR